MSKLKILLLILLVASLAVIITTVYNASTYSDFETAGKNKGKTVQIIGNLDTEREIQYDSTLENLSLRFNMIDNKGVSEEVIYYGSMPRDFPKMKEVVVTGHMQDTVFVAENLLLKCPTKYTSEADSMRTYNSEKK